MLPKNVTLKFKSGCKLEYISVLRRFSEKSKKCLKIIKKYYFGLKNDVFKYKNDEIEVKK
jgi:hypothetical protein